MRATAAIPRRVSPVAQTSARRVAPAAVGACGLLATLALLAAAAAAQPSPLVPASKGGFPDWLAGPLSGTGVVPTAELVDWLLPLACAAYVLILLSAESVPARVLAGVIVSAHLIVLLAPPLFSADVFAYLGYARAGVEHGLNPYAHSPFVAGDEVARFVQWHTLGSPYGPVFTVLSYGAAPLGVAGGLWALKAVTVAASLGAVALVWRCAVLLERSPRRAIAFFGLNPVLLLFAVGGAHNDALLVLLTVGGIELALRARPATGAAAVVAGAAIKASAGLALPFLVLGARQRGRAAVGAVAAALAVAVLTVVAFGGDIAGIARTLTHQQELVAVHSVPAEASRALELSSPHGSVQVVFLVLGAAAIAFALWRTWRGADWIAAAGWAMVALLVSTAWLLPWYVVWVLPFAALARDRRLQAVALALTLYVVATRVPALSGVFV